MGTDYSVIEKKIVDFVKKYYLNKLLKGVILTTLFFLLITFILIITEYFLYLSPSKKHILLSFYLLILSFLSVYFIIIPFLGFLGLHRKISRKKINIIIVTHFPEIKDQLWNLFELHDRPLDDMYSKELILASIDQKIDAVKNFKYSEAIDFKENYKFSILLFVFLLLGTLLTILSPKFILTPGERLKNFNVFYEKPSPYIFTILNDTLSVGKGDDYKLKVHVTTSENYESLLIHFGGNTYLMKEDSIHYFSYEFKTINNSLSLYFDVEGYHSMIYQLQVLDKPVLSSFSIDVVKPSYTYLKNERFDNITELVIPTGSKCTFTFNTYETDSIYIIGNDKSFIIKDDYVFEQVYYNDANLNISLKNSNFTLKNLLSLHIKTIIDEYPSITINQIIDSTEFSRIYFKGIINDDFGFDHLNFITKTDDQIDSTLKINILPHLLQQNFFFAFDFNVFRGNKKRINYYFEVFDNDGVNGSKSSVSEIFTFTFPEMDDVFNYQDEQFDDIQTILSESMNLTRELKNDMTDLHEKMINSELSDWERKETMKSIFSKKQKLEEAVDNIHKKNDELNNYLESFTEQNQNIVDKQKQIQNILEEVFSDEFKKLMEEFNKMINDFNENKMNELSEKMDISLDDLSDQLDKNIELLKKMKIEQQLNLITEDLKSHIEKQTELSKKIDKGAKPEDLLQQQQKEYKALQKLEEQYNKVKDLNEELENKINLFDFENEFDEIQREFTNSMENQSKNNKKKSKESMKKNAENMKNLSFMMQQMMDAAFKEQQSESLENLLQILDNTIAFSFGQESILSSAYNPDFSAQFMKEQKRLFDDFKVIKDSLYTLAKREPSINMAVNKEIVEIENNFLKIENNFAENRISQVKINQQYVLTAANNLALFMSEVIKQMQQQMANSKPGNQNCEKPGNNPNPNSMSNSMKSMQKSLQQQLEKMMQMKSGGEGGEALDNEMGKSLAQQEKMQQMIQQMMNQGNVGSGAYETLKEAEQLLNKVREDILRDNLSGQTVRRNKEILTRLLEAENAQNEREQDEKRKSNTAEKQRISETAKYFDSTLTKYNFEERLIRQKLNLKRYYQKIYQNYIHQLDSINGNKN